MESKHPMCKASAIATSALALTGPFVVTGIFLTVSRGQGILSTATADYVALFVSAAITPICISRLPLGVGKRTALAVLVTPALFVALVVFSYAFVGTVFDDWL